MPQLLSEKTVTARKPHYCSCCERVAIHPGEEYRREVYVYDGRAYSWVMCPPCADLTAIVWDWCGQPDEGIGADSCQEWALEHRDDAKYGTAARDYLARARMDEPTRDEWENAR